MLETLRQFRRRLAGTFGVLVGSAWLMLAAAPCIAAIQAEAVDHCPHCEQVELPCATLDSGDCDLPASLAASDEFKLKHPAFFAIPDVVQPAVPATVGLRPPDASADPPPLPCTERFCRYHE